MEPHGVGKRGLEQIVVAYAQTMKDFHQRVALCRSQFIHRAQVAYAEQHDFKRPHRPERYQDNKVLVAADNSFPSFHFQSEIIAQQALAVLPMVFELRSLFFFRLVGEAGIRPYLAMGMRLASAHHWTAVLKDLHVVDPGHACELPLLFYPPLYNIP